MKTNQLRKVILTGIILLNVFTARSQWINSITHVPANPTTADTIYFYADIDFPSGSCDQHTDMIFYSLPYVAVSSLHCLGVLTFICNHVDTFKINPLPAGNYTFVFHVDAGALPAPCTPGIVPGPTDSIPFTVSPASSVDENEIKNRGVLIFPNPAMDKINLRLSDEIASEKNKSLVIYSMEGKEIKRLKLTSEKDMEDIDISSLANGMYFCKVLTGKSASGKMKLIVIKQN